MLLFCTILNLITETKIRLSRFLNPVIVFIQALCPIGGTSWSHTIYFIQKKYIDFDPKSYEDCITTHIAIHSTNH